MADVVKQLLKMTESPKPPKPPKRLNDKKLKEVKAALDEWVQEVNNIT